MGWLLGCFKCTGESQQAKPKKQPSGVANSVSGRANSAAVAHATSPEDLHKVRKSPSNLAVERGLLESSSSSLSSFQDQAKINEGADLGSKLKETDKLNRERSFRGRLVQEPDVAKQLGDKAKDLRNCHRVLELPPDSFKVTLNKSEKDRSGQGDFEWHSWLVSSGVTRGGRLFETSPSPNNPFPGHHERGSLHGRVESGVSDEFVNDDGERLQPTYCKVELSTESAPSKHEVQSPPWTFSEAKLDDANHKNSYIFESSDDLLLEHLDVSSLIEDSALITHWELSSGELHSEKWGLHDQSPHTFQVPSEEEGKLEHNSGQTKQKHLVNRVDGESLDSDSSCSMAIFAVSSDDGTFPFEHPSVGEGDEEIFSAGNIYKDAKVRLLQCDELCTDIEGSDNESGSQRCFSSQFKLSKRLWSSTRKNSFEKEFSMVGCLHYNDNNVDEVLLPRTHLETQTLQQSKSSEDEHHPLLNASTESSETSPDIGVSYNELSGNHLQASTASFLESLVRRDSVEVFASADEMVAVREKDLNEVSSPTEEENGEQRKKLKLGQSSSSFESVQDSVEDQQVGLLKTANCQESSLEARVDISNVLESSASEKLLNESSLEQTSDVLLDSPSLSYVKTPIGSYRSPARLADDRPILGTVAAHWSPITTKKWWDGKGIPNSTNKYKEDQKVNWHAIPFEVRLEQALAKQDSML